MTVDQFAWWMALAWFYAWTVRHPRVTIRAVAACSCNEVGSELLASCALQIERLERFLIPEQRSDLSSTRGCKVLGRRLTVTVRETRDV